eukprot:CAMPEP_0197297142 /NCGR_PEP_ID=MMETSP0890-20130614/40247_1 /TAXON_ID=44058 ORGANISM="Aureoumbra lagunensis, Strain CCMP1510" /NCGR_SAMPLE_ID=MMETSP0890 /ASSEMBLY_ACC=CAM_ASM_000533 /LENGTH=354 /DNA_ID=CAMNT_0042774125 /DNA_START=172 /DNA_END=1236 /DNA_ORIENTATION=-
MALMVLLFLALQNCVKNIVMRAAVRGKANFLYSAAVIATEGLKCVASALWVLLIDRGTISSIFRYLRIEWRKTLLLMVPAAIYNFQKTLEYVALRNLNAAVFAVLVQTKLFTTAICAVGLMGKSLRRAQIISLVLLVVGCVLAQLDHGDSSDCSTATQIEKENSQIPSTTTDAAGNKVVGVIATLCIAFSSGFASVYTEKVIKAVDAVSSNASSSNTGSNDSASNNTQSKPKVESGLAYTQIQLAVASLLIEGVWAALTDFGSIQKHGLWYGFGWEAWLAVSMTALGGIAVAAVLKFADAILKGYATAISVVLTGLASHVLFGTVLNVEYGLGMINVIAAMVLYNSTNLNMRAF